MTRTRRSRIEGGSREGENHLRGHEAILAASVCYQQKIEALGLGFRAVRPDSECVTDPEVMRRMMDLRTGTVRFVREIMLPVLRESYEDTLAAAEGADLLVSHPITYATRLVAEKTGIPWASTVITPLGFFSVYDLPVFPAAPELSKKLRFLGPTIWGPLFRFGKQTPRSGFNPCCRGFGSSTHSRLRARARPWVISILRHFRK